MRDTMMTIAAVFLIVSGGYGLFGAWTGTDSSLFAWIAIVLGILALLITYGKKITRVVDQPEDSTSNHAHAEIRALIQSMGVMAVADSKVKNG